MPRTKFLTVPLLAAPALFACSNPAPMELPPAGEAARAAVVQKPGTNRDKLVRAADALFTDTRTAETRALLVLHDGQIVVERYGPGYDRNTRFVSWSMAKTITAVMIGQLVADGRLKLDESVPIPAWRRPGDPRGEITLRHLLHMRSGLRHTEAGNPPYASDEVRMLFLDGRDDMAAYAEAQPLEANPGSKWEYSSATTVILADLAARALTSSNNPVVRMNAVRDYLRTRLFDPIGMKTIVPEFDAAGTLIGGSLMHGTALDFAKFGEFLRNHGAVNGAQLVPSTWIDFMTSPSPQNAGYGGQLWLNHKQPDGTVQWRGASPSTFSMNGHLGQYVVVSRSNGVVAVRLGKTPDDAHVPLRTALARIVTLFPED